MVLASQKSCTYSLSLSTYQLTNSQITVEDAQIFALRNIHEKLPKAVSFTSIHGTFNIIGGIGAARVSALNNRIFRQSVHFPWSQMPIEVYTQPS